MLRGKSVLQLRVQLTGIYPPIWRRVLVGGHTSLLGLHHAFQNAMGWQDLHQHQFIIFDAYYGTPSDDPEGTDVIDEREVNLGDFGFRHGDSFIYEYDFGDSWEHEVTVEKWPRFRKLSGCPRCLRGERACPPEGCGGIRGYDELIEAYENIDFPDRDEVLAVAGPGFDPETFDVREANRRLLALR